MTFTLYLTILWASGVSSFNVPNFTTLSECQSWGRAWYATAQAKQIEKPEELYRWVCKREFP